MLLHYDENTNQLTRCYITNINDDTLISKLNTLDKTLEEYNKSLQRVSNKVWYSQNCKSFAFYEPYLYSCVRRQRNGQINIYLCLNIKVCNKLITIMCTPTQAGASIAFRICINGVSNDNPSTIIQTYINQYCREKNLSYLSDDIHYNPWGSTVYMDGEVNLDGDTYIINVDESITLCEPSEDHIFNYVYINDCNTYVLPTKGSTLIDDLVAPKFTPQASGITLQTSPVQISGVAGSYERLGRAPRAVFPMSNDFFTSRLTPDEMSILFGWNSNDYNSVRTEVTNFMDELENEGLAMRELPDDSILDELT
nr:MAG TPA: hypothetical protein [Caudoviricetes sp.]